MKSVVLGLLIILTYLGYTQITKVSSKEDAFLIKKESKNIVDIPLPFSENKQYNIDGIKKVTSSHIEENKMVQKKYIVNPIDEKSLDTHKYTTDKESMEDEVVPTKSQEELDDEVRNDKNEVIFEEEDDLTAPEKPMVELQNEANDMLDEEQHYTEEDEGKGMSAEVEEDRDDKEEE